MPASIASWHRVSVRISRPWRRWLRRSTALSVVLLAATQMSGSAAEGPYPGLPGLTGGQGAWTGITQTGLAETAAARQWVRVPAQVAAAFKDNNQQTTIFPPDDPLRTRTRVAATVFLVSPAGSDQNYGLSLPFTVRTVAFGSIPTEVTVQIVQPLGSDGYPVGLEAGANVDVYKEFREIAPGVTSNTFYDDAQASGRVSLRITAITIDGVPLPLAGRCQTQSAGTLSLVGRGYWVDTPGVDNNRLWLTNNYTPGSGGRLSGTLDIPRFDGCATDGGDDLSPLLTSAVSGPDNSVQLNVSGIYCSVTPPRGGAPGAPPPGNTKCVNDLTNLPGTGDVSPPEFDLPGPND